MNYTQIRQAVENAAVSGDEAGEWLLYKYTMEWDNTIQVDHNN